MIRVTKMDGSSMFLNGDWIQSVEPTPDTCITLTTGYKLMVKETVEDIIRAFKMYKQETHLLPGENQ